MSDDAPEFRARVTAVLARFFSQNAQPPLPAATAGVVAERLHAVIVERGLPAPLPPGENGEPGGMPDGECATLVARVLGDLAGPSLLGDAVKQLVKTCFYPEFKVCRDSYREVASDGACRRQQLKRVLGRTSGTHCVDCPYWVSLDPAPHAALLEAAWCGDPAEFHTHRSVYLPEDFRALRRWLYAAARRA